jgi:hypothetical protein
MTSHESAFQAFADEVVDHVITVAEMSDVSIELYFCIQQLQGPGPREEIAYLLRNGEHDAYFATDVQGRMWYCDCSRHIAREITSDTSFEVMSRELLDGLGCAAIGTASMVYH